MIEQIKVCLSCTYILVSTRQQMQLLSHPKKFKHNGTWTHFAFFHLCKKHKEPHCLKLTLKSLSNQVYKHSLKDNKRRVLNVNYIIGHLTWT